MLAEPRKRKRDYHIGCSSGQNKNWFKKCQSTTDGADSEGSEYGFGAKMLSKMGWAEGKGLGLHEQGMSEPIRVGKKSDTKGVGYVESNKVFFHMDKFNSILSSLSVMKSGQGDDKCKAVKVTKVSSLSGDGDQQPQLKKSSSFHSLDSLKRHKLCRRKLENKTLHNKNERDINYVLGFTNSNLVSSSSDSSATSSRVQFQISLEPNDDMAASNNSDVSLSSNSKSEVSEKLCSKTEFSSPVPKKKQKIDEANAKQHMTANSEIKSLENSNVHTTGKEIDESSEKEEHKLFESSMSVNEYFKQKMLSMKRKKCQLVSSKS